MFRNSIDCPKCGFGSYGARYVYGDKCYKYERTQQPWFEKKLDKYRLNLLGEISEAKEARGDTPMV